MQYCRFRQKGRTYYGSIREREGRLWIEEPVEAPEEDLAFRLEHEGANSVSFDPVAADEVELLAPVTPSKIVCVGRNYRDHVKELDHEMPSEPLIFLKPPSSLLAPGRTVLMPPESARVDYEGELAIVIGRRVRRLAAEDWRSAVRGYTLANDVTARDLQNKDGQWSRAKGFDCFCPVGPFVSDEIFPESGVELTTKVNRVVKQKGSTLDFIFPIPQLLEHITAFLTLEPGDIVLTGTPAGVGPLKPGDVVEIEIPGLGRLENSFAVESIPEIS